MLMGAQRKGQLMISVRLSECFPGSDIESLPKSYGGEGWFRSNRDVPGGGGSMCRHMTT